MSTFKRKVYGSAKGKYIAEINKTIPYPFGPICHSIFCAPTESGKTQVIANLLDKHGPYYKKFNKIFLVMPTYDDDIMKTTFTFKDDENDPECQVFKGYSDATLLRISSYVEAKLEEFKGKYNTLIIFDDCQEHFSAGSLLSKFITRCRHKNIHCWITAQRIKIITPNVRDQCKQFIIFPNSTKESLVALSDLFNDPKEFLDKCDLVREINREEDDNYGLLFVNLKTPQMYFYNFTDPI